MFNNAIRIGLFLLTAASAATSAAAEPLVFLGDNNTSATHLWAPKGFTKMGDHVYFSVYDDYHASLYRTGDIPGTVEVVKNEISSFSGSPTSDFAVANDTLFFAAQSALYPEWNLWRSDGTSSGTSIISGTSVSVTFGPSSKYFGTNDSLLFFSAAEEKLYKTDGTDSGTTHVLNLTGSVFATLENIVYFRGSDGTDGGELWRTDGSDVGTFLVKDINPGTAGSGINGLTEIDGVLYFAASDSVGPGLWKSDGTEAGTVKIAAGQINTSSGIVGADGYVYFVIGNQLWKSNGSPAGAEMVLDAVSEGYDFLRSLTSGGGKVFFTMRPVVGSSYHSLWSSDGTVEGTIELIPNFATYEIDFVEAGDKVYFNHRELWSSDGTIAGTGIARDLNPDDYSLPQNLANVDGKLYFSVIKGPAQGAVLELDPQTNEVISLTGSGIASSFGVSGGTRAGDNIYFSGWDGLHGWELWKTDGTAAGTHIVKDGIPGYEGLNPIYINAVGETVFFFSNNAANQLALWTSNGTPGGTTHIADIQANFVRHTAAAGDELYFTVNSPTFQDILWRSDGTPGGTYVVSDRVSEHWLTSNGGMVFLGGQMFAGGVLLRAADPVTSTVITLSNTSDNSRPYGPYLFTSFDNNSTMVTIDEMVYFPALNAQGRMQLYRTDGTTTGTTVINNYWQSGSSMMPMSKPVVGKILFSYDSTKKLFITDGTDSGTVEIGTYADSRPIKDPIAVSPLGEKIVFVGSGQTTGFEPWVTDGTSSGTMLLKDISPGYDGYKTPYYLVSADDLVYFITDDGIHGYELWRTDGTPEGTVLVKDINPGPGSSYPQYLTFADDQLVFSADDGVNGRELWTIASGETEPVMIDIAPGPNSGAPTPLNRVNNLFETISGNLTMQAYTAATGNDLWALPLGSESSVSDWNLY